MLLVLSFSEALADTIHNWAAGCKHFRKFDAQAVGLASVVGFLFDFMMSCRASCAPAYAAPAVGAAGCPVRIAWPCQARLLPWNE